MQGVVPLSRRKGGGGRSPLATPSLLPSLPNYRRPPARSCTPSSGLAAERTETSWCSRRTRRQRSEADDASRRRTRADDEREQTTLDDAVLRAQTIQCFASRPDTVIVDPWRTTSSAESTSFSLPSAGAV